MIKSISIYLQQDKLNYLSMKLRITLLAFFICLNPINPIFGQAKDTTNQKLGLGVSLFNLTEYTYESQSFSTIYVTYDLSSKFRIEPTIGFSKSDGKAHYMLGIGIFGIKPIQNFNLLYGLRLGAGSNEIFFVAPTLSGEYYFMKNFSVGSEVQLRVSSNHRDFTLLTNTSIIMRFYF